MKPLVTPTTSLSWVNTEVTTTGFNGLAEGSFIRSLRLVTLPTAGSTATRCRIQAFFTNRPYSDAVPSPPVERSYPPVFSRIGSQPSAGFFSPSDGNAIEVPIAATNLGYELLINQKVPSGAKTLIVIVGDEVVFPTGVGVFAVLSLEILGE